MKTLALFLLTASLAFCSAATPTTAPATSAPAENAKTIDNTVVNIIPQGDGLDLFNPSKQLNPEDGTMLDTDTGVFTWKGKSFDLGSSRAFRARFERFLNLNENDYDQQLAYRKLMNEVLDLLSPINLENSKANDNVTVAYNKLYEASNYPQDGGVSKVLAHMLYNTWRLRDEIKADNMQLTEEEKRALRQRADEDYRRNYEQWDRNRTAIEMKNRGVESSKVPELPSNSVTKPSLNSSEMTQANMAATSAAISIKGNLAKFQFQSQIVYLMLNRRFEHALMAANFYRVIFKSSSQKIEVGLDLLSKFLPKSDLVYTVEALEQICKEALNDVKGTMQTVDNSYEAKDMTAVLERLQENFVHFISYR
jgi:hypothetical protein